MDQTEQSVTPDALMHEIQQIRGDLKKFFERTNQVHLQSIMADLKHEYGEILSKNHVERAKECLSSNMVHDCEMHDTCFKVLLNFLTITSNHINDGEITDDLVRSYRTHLDEMRKKGPSERCDICFNEVRRLFEKQLDLMSSLGILKQQKSTLPLLDYPEEKIVSGIIEPIASTPRFQILQAVSAETKTFSDLSQLTKLRGGNLLFHIKKLQEAGMIIQRHERGDYVITEKGFKVLSAIREVYTGIVNKE
ncbi:winged helix-turn-helix domain-containing protein [Methanospirillum lacunae]|uniref:ArsR family transcriptional regulator n=1 Tax=Methanospirillum lacunae TaxID=668570 RepID=A0A2V2MYE1_9EURY|nr:winged helix-turn-helix domain-containing protein [Methanospirillum lacunae]PWR71290.1 ArsR family transcriptional regulator [Methanospirillum lacunae]